MRLTALLMLLALLVGCSRSEQRWRRSLADPDPFERALAALALVRIAPQRAVDALPVLLETTDRTELELGEAAQSALVRLAPFAPEALITAWLGDPLATEARRRALTTALRAAGPRTAIPLAAAARGVGIPRARPALALLSTLGEAGVLSLASLALETSDPRLADAAAQELLSLGPAARAALPVLRSAARSATTATRGRAAQLLRALAGGSDGR